MGSGSGRSWLRLASVALRAGVGLVVLVIALGIFGFLVSTAPEPVRVAIAERTVSVRAVRVREVPIARPWDGYGTARAMLAADVSAEVPGRVVARPASVEPGSAVSAGDVLLRLDDTDYRARVAGLEQVVASLASQIDELEIEERGLGDRLELAQDEEEIARRDLQRVLEARERGGGNESDVDLRRTAMNRVSREVAALREQYQRIGPRRATLEATMERERAGLLIAREELQRTEIRAPIAGVLQSVGPRIGDRVSTGEVVARVVDLSRVEVPLRLPVSALRSVGVGSPAVVSVDSTIDARDDWVGSVARVAPEAEASTRTATVFVEVEQGGAGGMMIRPGQFVAGRVMSGSAEPALVVPRAAIEGDRVVIAERVGDVSRTRRVPVRVRHYAEGLLPTVDPVETQWAVIESGLSAGDLVVVSNLDDLRDGTSVVVREADGDARASDGRGGGGS